MAALSGPICGAIIFVGRFPPFPFV